MDKKKFLNLAKTHQKSIESLAELPVFQNVRNTKNAAERMKEAKEIVAEAQKLGVPLFLLHDRSHRYTGYSILDMFLPEMGKASRYLIEQGVNIWLSNLDYQMASADSHHMPSLQIQDSYAILQNIFPQNYRYKQVSPSSRRLYLLAALKGLEHLPDENSKEIFEELVDHFLTLTKSVSLTRPGLLSVDDKNALLSSQIVIEQIEEFKKLKPLLGDKGAKKVDDMLQRSEAIIKIKLQNTESVFDPELLKKKLNTEQKERVKTLTHIMAHCPSDTKGFNTLLNDSPWVLENPQLLALTFRGMSFVHHALVNVNQQAFDYMEKLNVNIWLAAAQANVQNAPWWIATIFNAYDARKHKARHDVVLPQIARLLAFGALLDGAKDPIDFAVKKTEEAYKGADENSYHYDRTEIKEFLLKLKSQLETVAMDDLIKNLPTSNTSGQAALDPVKPKARRL